jgi:hypothetical protein
VNDGGTSNALPRGQSELLTEDTVPRRVQGAMSYKFRTGLEVNDEVKGDP